MKVLDPQAALLTNAEVYRFIQTNSPRKPDKKSGAYEPVNLAEALNVRKDFKRYIDLTSPHIKSYPSQDQFIGAVVQRLRAHDLTKTEALSLINLGLGLPRSQLANVNAEPNAEKQGDTNVETENKPTQAINEVDAPTSDTLIPAAAEEGAVEPNFRALADCVIENIGERFPGAKGEEEIEQILNVLKECIEELTGG